MSKEQKDVVEKARETLGGRFEEQIQHAKEYIHEHWGHTRSNRTKFSLIQDSKAGTAILSLLAGGIAGAVSRTLVAPFERLKIMFQVQGNPPVYTSVYQGLLKIAKEEGIKGYYKGNGVNIIRIFPTSAIQYFSFDNYKKLYIKQVLEPTGKKDLSVLERLVIGGLAGITALILTYPLEMVRARLTIQTSTTQYRGIGHALTTVARNEGFFALYKGLVPSIIGVVPYVGIDFAVFESLKQLIRDKKGTVNSKEIFCCGGIAAMCAQTFAYPLDVIRRRLQIQGFQTDLIKHERHYTGMVDAGVKIWKGEGFFGFYRGSTANYIKVIPMQATSFLIYDTLKKHFKF